MDIKEAGPLRPIEERIAWAEHCHALYRSQLLEDSRVVEYLGRLKQAITVSRKEMEALGIVQVCRQCEEHEGGSCCGAGLEDKYDGWLLLVNLLLERLLPKKRHDLRGCLFLGPQGCLLSARHVICINYLCKKISHQIEPNQIASLREKEGRELEALFLLHERIKVIVRGLAEGDYGQTT